MKPGVDHAKGELSRPQGGLSKSEPPAQSKAVQKGGGDEGHTQHHLSVRAGKKCTQKPAQELAARIAEMMAC